MTAAFGKPIMKSIRRLTIQRTLLAITLLLFSVIETAEPQPQPVAESATQESAASRLAASAGQDKEQLARRIESVGHLLETSSAARQIETSQDSQALAVREEARTLYKAARAAFDAGDLQKASRLLNETTILMLKAVRFAAPEDITGKKEETDFKVRQESVKALLQTLLKDEDRHLRIIKDLYRDLTHC